MVGVGAMTTFTVVIGLITFFVLKFLYRLLWIGLIGVLAKSAKEQMGKGLEEKMSEFKNFGKDDKENV